MTDSNHLTNALLVRAIDDELPESDAALVGSHLSNCEECTQKYQELATLSNQLHSFVTGVAIRASEVERESLKKRLQPQERSSGSVRSLGRALKPFALGMAIAATLAIGITLAPHMEHVPELNQAAALQPTSTETFEVDGETFVALPYSNADLPLTAPHILQMRIPVSSLTAAGIAFEPIPNELSADQDSVVADVLLGMDGQPLGVHVTALE